jgi:hypothetical protein
LERKLEAIDELWKIHEVEEILQGFQTINHSIERGLTGETWKKLIRIQRDNEGN